MEKPKKESCPMDIQLTPNGFTAVTNPLTVKHSFNKGRGSRAEGKQTQNLYTVMLKRETVSPDTDQFLLIALGISAKRPSAVALYQIQINILYIYCLW